jgi:hypothetical protein
MKDYRKLYADTIVQTTHMLKKSVMIPLKHDEDGKTTEQTNINHPFMRGVMEFDDFNYTQFNNLVLIPEPNQASPKKFEKTAADTESVRLSVKSIDQLVNDKQYVHETIVLPQTPAEIQYAKMQ